MMGKAINKLFAMGCAVSLLLTMPGMLVLADEMQEEEIILSDTSESEIVKSILEDERICEDIADDIIPEIDASDSSVSSDEVVVEDAVEAELNHNSQEEIVGSGDITVGGGVTASVSTSGAVVFYSNGGTLNRDWAYKLEKDGYIIRSIKVDTHSIVQLPSDSHEIFEGLDSMTVFDPLRFDTSNVTNMARMFRECRSLSKLDLSSFKTSKVTNMAGMFSECRSLSKLNMSSFNTSKVTNMAGMFSGCESLGELDLSSFNTSNVTDMGGIFINCESLSELDLSSFDTSKATSMMRLFKNCRGLRELDLSNFNTSNVTDMWEMFCDCSSLSELDLSSFNTTNVTDMDDMFRSCGNLRELNLSSFNTSNVKGMYDMFLGCSSLTKLDLSSFNTVNVSFMHQMFWGCSSLVELDLSSFDTTNVTDYIEMFYDCASLVVLKTPKKNSIKDIDLPVTMYDRDGTEYHELPVLSESIMLTNDMLPKIDITKCTITLSQTSYTYDGEAKKPSVTVKDGNTTLTAGTDYTVSYKKNTNAGTATVTVTGMGNCYGTINSEFTIKRASAGLKFAEKSVSKSTLDGAFTNSLMKATDGEVTFSSGNTNIATVDSKSGLVKIKDAGTVVITATAVAVGNYNAGNASYTLTVLPGSIEKVSVAGVSLSYGYSGKAYIPDVTVKANDVILTEGKDYTIQIKNNINPGTATIIITGKGKYTGTRIKRFEIVDCVSSLVSGKTYQLIPKNNSKTAVCSYSGKMVNNTKVYITDRSNSEAMRFKAVKNSDGTWKFINSKCELALAVQQNSSEVGKGLVLYDQTTKTAQNWKLEKKSDNSFAIRNAVSGLSIAMSDESAVKGTTLSMAETQSNGLQRFYIVEASAVSVPFDGTYAVRASANNNFALNIASSSKDDGANVNLYSYSNTKDKKFKVMYSGGGYYRLVNLNSGLCLTVKGNSNADGTNIIQSKWAAGDGQRWKIKKNSDGTVTFTNALGTNIHLVSNKTANGTNIVAKNPTTSKAQKWYLN